MIIDRTAKCYHDSYAENEPDCRWSSPEEVALREHVEAVNKKHGVEFKMA